MRRIFGSPNKIDYGKYFEYWVEYELKDGKGYYHVQCYLSGEIWKDEVHYTDSWTRCLPDNVIEITKDDCIEYYDGLFCPTERIMKELGLGEESDECIKG